MKQPKLVRDRIPEIIKAEGRAPKTRIANDAEYYDFLVKKLDEEVAEFKQQRNAEELHDILEVLHAIANHNNISAADLEQKRKQKAEERGSFKKKIILEDW